jgi:hypothetical protein
VIGTLLAADSFRPRNQGLLPRTRIRKSLPEAIGFGIDQKEKCFRARRLPAPGR